MRYEPNPKHKTGHDPRASLCPHELTVADAQALLERSVEDPTTQGEPSRWVYDQGWIFRARLTSGPQQTWHGYPVKGCEVRKEVMAVFLQRGWIDRAKRAELYAQQALPARWPEAPR